MQQYGNETERDFEMALVQSDGKVTVLPQGGGGGEDYYMSYTYVKESPPGILPTLLVTRQSKRSCQIMGSSGTEQFFHSKDFIIKIILLFKNICYFY